MEILFNCAEPSLVEVRAEILESTSDFTCAGSVRRVTHDEIADAVG